VRKSGVGILQTRCPSCHPTNSVKAPTCLHTENNQLFTEKYPSQLRVQELIVWNMKCRDNLCRKNSAEKCIIQQLKTYSQGISAAETLSKKVWSDKQTSLPLIVLLRLHVHAQLLKHANNEECVAKLNKHLMKMSNFWKNMTMTKTYWHNPAIIQSACVKWHSEYPQLCNVSYIRLRVNQIRVFKVKDYHLNQLGPDKT